MKCEVQGTEGGVRVLPRAIVAIARGSPFAVGIVDEKAVLVVSAHHNNVPKAGEVTVNDAGSSFCDRLPQIRQPTSHDKHIHQPIGFCHLCQIQWLPAAQAIVFHVSIEFVCQLPCARSPHLEVGHHHCKRCHIASSSRIQLIV